MPHGFILILDATNLEDLPLDALHDAIEDGSIEDSSDVVYMEFFREAPTRDDAVITAVRDVTTVLVTQGSPYRVVRVEPAGFDPCTYDTEPAKQSDVA